MIPLNTPVVLDFVGDGTEQITFPISFPTFEESNIEAQIIAPNGDITNLVFETHFTLNDIGIPNTDASFTLVISTSFAWTDTYGLKDDYTLRIKFTTEAQQPSKLRDLGRFAPDIFEKVLDRLTMNILALRHLALELPDQIEAIQNSIDLINDAVASLIDDVDGFESRISALEDAPDEQAYTIANDITAPLGLTFDGTERNYFSIVYGISRKVTGTELVESGELRGIYNTTTSTWYLSNVTTGPGAGVTFSINSSGVLSYTSTNLVGASYQGSMKLYVQYLISGGGSGEANTASNLGSGQGVFGSKAGVDLKFKSLVAGTNVSLSSTANEITINSTGGSGETNTASNLGSGEGVYSSKVGVDLKLKSLVAGSNISLSSTANEITINATASSSQNLDAFLGQWVNGYSTDTSPNYVDLVFDGLKWVAIGTDILHSSSDGKFYSSQTGNGLPSIRDNIFFLNGYLYITSGNSSTIYRNSGGTTWTAVSAFSNIQSMVYAAGKYIASGLGSTKIGHSTDGLTWTGVSGLTASYYSVVHTGTEFIALGRIGSPNFTGYVARSNDGITWTENSLPSSVAGSFRRMVYGNGFLAAVGPQSLVGQPRCIYSTDNGVNWISSNILNTTIEWEDIIYIPSHQAFMAIRPTAPSNNHNAISAAFTENFITWKYLILPQGTSTSGVNWNRAVLGFDRISIVGDGASAGNQNRVCCSPSFRFIT